MHWLSSLWDIGVNAPNIIKYSYAVRQALCPRQRDSPPPPPHASEVGVDICLGTGGMLRHTSNSTAQKDLAPPKKPSTSLSEIKEKTQRSYIHLNARWP